MGANHRLTWGTFLASCAASLAIAAAAPAQTGTPTLDPRDPHRFVMDGRPWLLTGYTPGLGAFTFRRDDVSRETYATAYHSWLQSRGINSYRAVFSMGQIFRGTPKRDETLPYEFVPDLDKVDLDAFNEAHFDYWRRLITDAGRKGIVVQLSLFDSWHLNEIDHGNGWGRIFDFYYGLNNVNGVTFDLDDEGAWHSTAKGSPVYLRQVALVHEVVRRLGDLPNLIWEVCNEAGAYYDTWARPLGKALKSADGGRHLVNPLDFPDHQHTPGQKPPEHRPEAAHDALVARFSEGQPLISHNDARNSFLSAGDQRKKGWAALTAGAHVDYFFNGENRADFRPGSAKHRGARYLGFLPGFVDLLGVRLAKMEPSDSLVRGPVPKGSWCLARPGEQYVIYKRELAGNGWVEVHGLPSSYRARWFNPRSGAVAPLDAVGESAPRWQRFTPPAALTKDWVLHIVALEPATASPQE